MINSNNVNRLFVGAALATGLLSSGVAASAQTTATPAVAPATTVATSSNSTTVGMSMSTNRPNRKAELEQANADARRVAFRHLGTSL